MAVSIDRPCRRSPTRDRRRDRRAARPAAPGSAPARGRAADAARRRDALPGRCGCSRRRSRRTGTSTPCRPSSSTSAHARPLQGRLRRSRRRRSACPGLQELGHRRRGLHDARHRARASRRRGPTRASPIKAKKDQLFFILSTRFMPPVVVVIPIFLMFRDLGLLDTQLGLILVYAAFNLPFTIWMMKGFVDEVPGGVRGRRDARRLLALRGVLARHHAPAHARASPRRRCSR